MPKAKLCDPGVAVHAALANPPHISLRLETLTSHGLVPLSSSLRIHLLYLT